MTYVDRTWTSHDGLQLYARDYAPSAGPARCPVICIHGLTRNSADFEEVAPWIAAQGRRVLVVDVRGRGKSAHDPDTNHYNPLVYAKDIVSMTTQLGIARAIFIGTSMGGLITMTLALRHLKLIAGAILNDVGPAISLRGIERIKNYAGKGKPVDSWQAAADYIRDTNGIAFPDNTMDDWMKFARRTFREDADGKLTLMYDPGIAKPLQGGKVKASSFIARWAFSRLANKRPTMLIRGELSDIIESEQADAMRRAAPRLHYVEVPRVGHAPMLMEQEARAGSARFLEIAP
jgi:pimeloyl-ACP methyl ester carboxylesterase